MSQQTSLILKTSLSIDSIDTLGIDLPTPTTITILQNNDHRGESARTPEPAY